MEVQYIKDYRHINSSVEKLSLVLGYFDGLHIGHEQLINFAKFNSKGPVGVITFDRPLKSIEGCLTSLEQKIDRLRELKIDYVYVIVASDDFRHMSYIDFISKVLKKLNPVTLYCGNDFTFGYEAKGDVNDLKMAFSDVKVVSYVNDFNHKKISSSNIKKLIKSGDVKEASVFLGRPYSLRGTIGRGFQEGTKLGTPTANIALPVDYIIPKDGVYITKTKVDKRTYRSVTNIGTHPTVNQIEKPIIETYIIGLNRNIYGKDITIYFYNRLRDEVKFESVEKLEEQIKKDVDSTNRFFTKL